MSEVAREILRKSIHFLGIGYIPLYTFFGKEITLLVVGALTAFAVFLEVLRRRYSVLPEWMLRAYEVRGVGAYLYFGISARLITLIFPKNACFAGIVVGSIGDGVAGIVKKLNLRFAHPAMFFTSYVALLFFGLHPAYSALSCFAGVLAERYCRIGEYYVNDNLSVPFLSALVYFLLSFPFLSQLCVSFPLIFATSARFKL